MVELTKIEAGAIANLIELNIFEIIRNDTDIDNIEWLCAVMEVYKKCEKEK